MTIAKERYTAWLNAPQLTEEERAALRAMPKGEMAECFGSTLAFGTGGLRGKLGLGTARMNRLCVAQATQGLADFMNANGRIPRVAIAHDSRHYSRAFAETAASVLAANGITALLYPRLQPTPALSFAVRDQGCGAGICITASHNPAIYNGYKVYGSDGCQITLEDAETIQQAIAQVNPVGGVKLIPYAEGLTDGRIRLLGEEVINRFLDAVLACGLRKNQTGALRVVYTPLNGAGRECVTRMMDAIGLTDVHVVAEQANPDGAFPTCPYPNPEIREALALGLRDADTLQADLLLATDPDCDRVGIAVRGENGMTLMSGNEVGVLLMDYIAATRKELGLCPDRPVMVTTIVSTAMADAVAAYHGVELRRVLTGFKFIGETIAKLEAAGEKERFLLGFEESYGYLTGTHARDKDAVNASLLILEMARYYKAQGLTLLDAYRRLEERFGCYAGDLSSYTFEGNAGMVTMAAIMKRLREQPVSLPGFDVLSVTDYLSPDTGLPAADVLRFDLAGDARLMVRPSGTEPKLKAYFFAREADREAARSTMERLKTAADRLIAGEAADV